MVEGGNTNKREEKAHSNKIKESLTLISCEICMTVLFSVRA